MKPADCRDLRHPIRQWSQRDWDEFLHLNEMCVDDAAIAAARERETTPTPTTTPAAAAVRSTT